MQQVDPWLGDLWDRELLQREFSPAAGVFGEAGKPGGVLLPDGAGWPDTLATRESDVARRDVAK